MTDRTPQILVGIGEYSFFFMQHGQLQDSDGECLLRAGLACHRCYVSGQPRAVAMELNTISNTSVPQMLEAIAKHEEERHSGQ